MNPVTALSAVPHDKAMHFIAGTLTYAGCHLLQLGDNVCLAVAVGVGVAKEVVYDKMLHLGHPDVWDAAATAGGALIGYSITIKF